MCPCICAATVHAACTSCQWEMIAPTIGPAQRAAEIHACILKVCSVVATMAPVDQNMQGCFQLWADMMPAPSIFQPSVLTVFPPCSSAATSSGVNLPIDMLLTRCPQAMLQPEKLRYKSSLCAFRLTAWHQSTNRDVPATLTCGWACKSTILNVCS